MPATDAQVQTFVNERVRPRAEQVRALLLAMEDDRAAFDDVYAALAQTSPTWADTRADGPPHLLTPADVLAWNTFLYDTIAAMRGNAQLAPVLAACVRPVNR
jgi:hypothetical protein